MGGLQNFRTSYSPLYQMMGNGPLPTQTIFIEPKNPLGNILTRGQKARQSQIVRRGVGGQVVAVQTLLIPSKIFRQLLWQTC